MENLPPQVIRRVTKEVVELAEDPPEGIKVYLNEEDITDIQATIEGPGASLHELVLSGLVLMHRHPAITCLIWSGGKPYFQAFPGSNFQCAYCKLEPGKSWEHAKLDLRMMLRSWAL